MFNVHNDMISDIAVCQALRPTENSVMAHYWAMAHRLKTSGLDEALSDCNRYVTGLCTGSVAVKRLHELGARENF